jgi:hypothetical protein
MLPIRYATFVLLLSLVVGCGDASYHTTQRSASTSRSTSTSASSTRTAVPRGCQSAGGSGFVAEVFCYLNKAGVANQTIDSDCGPLLAHDLQDPGHACLNGIESYQTLLTTARSDLRVHDFITGAVWGRMV